MNDKAAPRRGGVASLQQIYGLGQPMGPHGTSWDLKRVIRVLNPVPPPAVVLGAV